MSAAKKNPKVARIGLTDEQKRKLDHYDQIMERFAALEAEEKARAARRTEIEQEEAKGLHLSPEDLRQLSIIIADINFAAVAANRSARDAIDGSRDQAEWRMVAAENLAKVIARKCDVLRSRLEPGGSYGFGNFADEFEVKVPQQPAVSASKAA